MQEHRGSRSHSVSSHISSTASTASSSSRSRSRHGGGGRDTGSVTPDAEYASSSVYKGAISGPSTVDGSHDDDDDEDVRMAIAALGIMRSGSHHGGSLPPAGSSSSHDRAGTTPIATPSIMPYSMSNASMAAASSSANNTISSTPTSTITSFPSTSTSSFSISSGTTGSSSPIGPRSASVSTSASDLGDPVVIVDESERVGEGDPNFISRMSQLPLVSGGLEWYEKSKASSRVVKYGAGLVESSLSSISRPLANNNTLGQLDDFACRQLDRLSASGANAGPGGTGTHPSSVIVPLGSTGDEEEEYHGRTRSNSSSSSKRPRRSDSVVSSSSTAASNHRWPPVASSSSRYELDQERIFQHRDASSQLLDHSSQQHHHQLQHGQSQFHGQNLYDHSHHQEKEDNIIDDDDNNNTKVALRTRSPIGETRLTNSNSTAIASTQSNARSRWQSVLVEAGGLGAAVSEESLKSLRYCLQWLLYATARLDHQITILRDFISSLNRTDSSHSTVGRGLNGAGGRGRNESTRSSSEMALITASASAHLAQIKHDVVETIRKVVEVVSKYAGAALPEPAKRYVKQSILGLPVKWASAIEGGAAQASGGGSGVGSVNGLRGRGSRGMRGTSVFSNLSEVSSSSAASTPTAERMEDPTLHYNHAHHSHSNGDDDSSTARDQDGTSEAAGTSLDYRHEGSPMTPSSTTPTPTTALQPTEDAAERVLTFAVESLDMLKSVCGVFGDSVEKAEAWIERLRVVGLDRQRRRNIQQDEQNESGDGRINGEFGVGEPLESSRHEDFIAPPAKSTGISPSQTHSSGSSYQDVTTAAGTKRRRAFTKDGKAAAEDHHIGIANELTKGRGGLDHNRLQVEEDETSGETPRRRKGARSRENTRDEMEI